MLSRLPRRRIWSVVTALAVAPAAAGVPDDSEGPRSELEKVYYDAPDEQGRLSGGFIRLPRPGLAEAGAAVASPVTTIVDNGPPSNRIDLVTVGDGYLVSQLAIYAAHANSAQLELFAQEPFATYASFFNVHRVDVTSPESGVDNDPVQGILRDTALDMAFWCSGIERLLCVDVMKAYHHANAAPDVDQVLAIANSSKYGGAGYSSSELATFAGANGFSTEIAIHELGHSLGNLADEYDYGDGAAYGGPEPSDRNVSMLDADAMAAAGTKWAAWLGTVEIAFDGLVDAYEGAMYHEFGIYRPTVNSKMRSLDRPFNFPSAEALIIEFYRIVDPIDSATPNGTPLDGSETVVVDPVDPISHALTVRWRLDGEPVGEGSGTALDLSALDLAPGAHVLDVEVVDDTELVRDEPARASWMTATRVWQISVDASADLDGDGVVGFTDLVLLLSLWGNCPAPPMPCLADLDGDGQVGFSDLLELVAAWS